MWSASLACAIAACAWVQRWHKSTRIASAQDLGPASAFALASLAEPKLADEPTTERAQRWYREFRRISPDTLLVNQGAHDALGLPQPLTDTSTVTLRGMPPQTALAAVAVLSLVVIVLLWGTSGGWLDFAVGVLFDFTLGVGAMWWLLLRERRLGGDRLVGPGSFQHGAVIWTPLDSVMVLRRRGLLGLSWYELRVIGTPGVAFMTLSGRQGRVSELRRAASLWATRPAGTDASAEG